MTKAVIDTMSTDELQRPLKSGSLPLEVGIYAENAVIINAILDRKVSVDGVMRSMCTYGCEPATARRVISNCTSLHDLNKPGLRLIHVASRNGQDGIIEELILSKVDINSVTANGETPLHLAISHGHLSTAKFLVKHGALTFAKDKSGASIAHMAALSNNESMYRLVWEQGVPWDEGAVYAHSSNELRNALPLHLASLKGHISCVKFLFDNQLVSDVNIIADSHYSSTPLHLACWANNIETANYLLSKGADVNSTQGYPRYTPLHLAALVTVTCEEESIVPDLLVHQPDLEKLDWIGRTPEILALEIGNKTVAQMIREHRTKLGMSSLESSSRRETFSLIHTVSIKRRHGSRKLTQPIADQRMGETLISNPTDSSKLEDDMRVQMSRRFTHAECDGDIDMCEYMIEKGIDVDSLMECSGCTPFIFSCHRGNFNICLLLLENGANYNRTACESEITKGYTAIHYAACYGDLIALEFLLGKLTAWSSLGVKPFHLAAANGHLQCLNFLLDYEQSISDAKELHSLGVKGENSLGQGSIFLKRLADAILVSSGTTALHLASSEGEIEVAAFLLEKGAHPEQSDETGQTAFHCAAENGHAEVVDILLEKDIYCETTDEHGCTPLQLAVRNNQVAIVRRLLAEDCNVNCRDKYMVVPFYMMQLTTTQ